MECGCVDWLIPDWLTKHQPVFWGPTMTARGKCVSLELHASAGHIALCLAVEQGFEWIGSDVGPGARSSGLKERWYSTISRGGAQRNSSRVHSRWNSKSRSNTWRASWSRA